MLSCIFSCLRASVICSLFTQLLSSTPIFFPEGVTAMTSGRLSNGFAGGSIACLAYHSSTTAHSAMGSPAKSEHTRKNDSKINFSFSAILAGTVCNLFTISIFSSKGSFARRRRRSSLARKMSSTVILFGSNVRLLITPPNRNAWQTSSILPTSHGDG